MHSFLVPCPACARHARAWDVVCPFCSASLEAEGKERPQPRVAHLHRAALFAGAIGASAIALSACSSPDSNLEVPYGLPPMEDSGILFNGDAGDAASHDAASLDAASHDGASVDSAAADAAPELDADKGGDGGSNDGSAADGETGD